jgi:hypothetical protein
METSDQIRASRVQRRLYLPDTLTSDHDTFVNSGPLGLPAFAFFYQKWLNCLTTATHEALCRGKVLIKHITCYHPRLRRTVVRCAVHVFRNTICNLQSSKHELDGWYHLASSDEQTIGILHCIILNCAQHSAQAHQRTGPDRY